MEPTWWIPCAWLLPRWFLRWASDAIDDACVGWLEAEDGPEEVVEGTMPQ